MKLQQGDKREQRIAELQGWAQSPTRNASAINNCDCIDGNGNGYEIKGWRGSWHTEPQKPIDNNRSEENNARFIAMLQAHKAKFLVPIIGNSKGKEYYTILTFDDYIDLFRRYGNRTYFYSIDVDIKSNDLKFRPVFNQRIFKIMVKELNVTVYDLV